MVKVKRRFTRYKMVEGATESLPQIALQVYATIKYADLNFENMDDIVYYGAVNLVVPLVEKI